jgi:hypothetical protein
VKNGEIMDMGKLKSFIKKPGYFITSAASRGLLDWVPDELYIKLLHRMFMGEKCSLNPPRTYNEKLQWLKLHDRKPEYVKMVDKYEVRSYIKELFGEEYLIPCYGVYNTFEEIDFERLPDQFVLKCTHDSGSVIICKDKASFDKNEAKQRLEKAMKKNYYRAYREWPYKEVKPRIIIEQYMEEEKGGDLTDYKIMCFNGKAKVVKVHEDRFSDEHTQTFYDREWNRLPFGQGVVPPTTEKRQKPKEMETLFAMSEKITKDMYHARVDWYVIRGRIYFGEITFYNSSALKPFSSREDDLYLGSLLKLPTDE